MKIRFYGRLREKLGAEIDVDPPAGTDTVGGLRDRLTEIFPDSAYDLQERSRACVADMMVGEDHHLDGVEAVEFFPPLSGG